MVPVSSRSGLRAESREGPQPGGWLPAGSQPGTATADVHGNREENDFVVKSIVDRYLGSNEPEAAGSSNMSTGGNNNDDNNVGVFYYRLNES